MFLFLQIPRKPDDISRSGLPFFPDMAAAPLDAFLPARIHLGLSSPGNSKAKKSRQANVLPCPPAMAAMPPLYSAFSKKPPIFFNIGGFSAFLSGIHDPHTAYTYTGSGFSSIAPGCAAAKVRPGPGLSTVFCLRIYYILFRYTTGYSVPAAYLTFLSHAFSSAHAAASRYVSGGRGVSHSRPQLCRTLRRCRG